MRASRILSVHAQLRAVVLLILALLLIVLNPGIVPQKATALPDTPQAGTVRTDPKGIKQVYVPAGCFLHGSDPAVDLEALDAEMPQHKVCITKGFWVDQFEITNTEYQPFIDAGSYKNSQLWSDDGWA